jgi:hypothetical protein
MINGAHILLYSAHADRDRALLKDVLGLPHVDVGGGWLIFGLPPAEIAVHPGDENDVHELYLMCEDIEKAVAALGARGVACSPRQNQGWGIVSQITLPGGGRLGIYEPRHARPKPMAVKRRRTKQKKSVTQRRGARRVTGR